MKTAHSSSRLPFFFFFPVPWKQAWWNLLSPQRKHREKKKRTRSHYLSPRNLAKQQALLIYSKKEKTRIHQTFQKKKKKRSALKWGKPYFQHLVCLQLRRKLPWFSFLFFFFPSSSYFATIEAAHVLCKGKKRSTRRKKKRVVCGKYFLNAAPAMTRFTSSPSLHRAFCSACECPLTKYGRMQPWQKENKKKKTTHQQKSS